MNESENEGILFKETKKESCNIHDNSSSTKRQLYLQKLENKHSSLTPNNSNNRETNENNLSEMDSSVYESNDIVNSVGTVVRTYSRKRKKKTLSAQEPPCQDVVMSENSNSSLLIDLKNNYASDDETLEEHSLIKKETLNSSKIEKKRIFDDVDVDNDELDTSFIDVPKNVFLTDPSQEVQSIPNRSNSKPKTNYKKEIERRKESLDEESRKKLERLMKSALEKSAYKEKNKQTAERKAQSKENYTLVSKPKLIKEDFKPGDKVLVESYNGEITGPFIIVELLGKLSCRLRSVNAVSCGGLFSDEREEKLQVEWLQNLVPFKKKNDSIKKNIKVSSSDKHLGLDSECDTNIPKKTIISTPEFYSRKPKSKIDIQTKSKKLKGNAGKTAFNEKIDLDYKTKSSLSGKENPETRISLNLRKKEEKVPEKVVSGPVVEWVKSLRLNSSHKEILLDDETMLTTDIIDSANQLIRKKWPFADGLRTPFQVQSSTGFPAMKSGGVQIFYDEERLHWFTASNMREHIELADSMVPDGLSYSAQEQLVQCFRDYEENGILKVHMLPVCQQDNEIDCGLYAIANAIEFICESGDPLNPYIRSSLRDHLIECFEKGEIQRFPTATIGTQKRCVNQPKKTKVEVIMVNKILERCKRLAKRTANKPKSDEIIVELSSDSE